MTDTNSSGQPGDEKPPTRGRTIAIVILSVFAAILVGIIIWLVATSNATPAPTPTPTASPSASVTPTPTSTTTTPPALSACTVSNLTITLGETQGAAGSRYVPIVFTNKGTAPCTLNGYPAVAFVGDGNGTQIGPPADNDPTTTPQSQTLQPGSSGTAQLRVAVAQNFSGCTAVTPDGFRIAPPGSSASAFVAYTALQACNNPDIHLLTVQAITPTP